MEDGGWSRHPAILHSPFSILYPRCSILRRRYVQTPESELQVAVVHSLVDQEEGRLRRLVIQVEPDAFLFQTADVFGESLAAAPQVIHRLVD